MYEMKFSPSLMKIHMSKIILVLLYMKRKILNIDANVPMTRKLVQIYDFVFLKCDPKQNNLPGLCQMP